MIVSSNILNPILPIGSPVALICTVYLSPAVDIPVTVNTVWTGPAGFMVTNIAAVEINATTYISITLIDSFGRNRFGNYTCAVTVSSRYANSFLSDSNLQSGTTMVAFGTYIYNLVYQLIPDFCFLNFRSTSGVGGVMHMFQGNWHSSGDTDPNGRNHCYHYGLCVQVNNQVRAY